MSRAERGERGGHGEDCDDVRESISALLNGTKPLCFPGEIDDHLSSCEPCRAWEAEAIAMRNRSQHNTSQDAVPASPREADPRPVLQLRYALGIVAVTEMAPGIIWLVEAIGGPTVEPARELVAAEIAFAVGCLVAALQPRCARKVLPVGVALTMLIVGMSVADVARGMATPLGESHVMVEFAGTAMLALVAGRVDRASIDKSNPGQGP